MSKNFLRAGAAGSLALALIGGIAAQAFAQTYPPKPGEPADPQPNGSHSSYYVYDANTGEPLEGPTGNTTTIYEKNTALIGSASPTDVLAQINAPADNYPVTHGITPGVPVNLKDHFSEYYTFLSKANETDLNGGTNTWSAYALKGLEEPGQGTLTPDMTLESLTQGPGGTADDCVSGGTYYFGIAYTWASVQVVGATYRTIQIEPGTCRWHFTEPIVLAGPTDPGTGGTTVTVTATVTETVTNTVTAPPQTVTLPPVTTTATQTVTQTLPAQTVTLPAQTVTATTTETLAAQTVTVTAPAQTVTLPAQTVTATTTETLPAQTVTATTTETLPAQTVTETLPAQTVTETLPGTTVTLPAQTVTETLPGTTVTLPGTTITQPAKTVTETLPGTTVTLPGTTVTAPGQTITLPGTTVTETKTLPGQTITETKTLPGQTVTATKTLPGQTITETKTLPGTTVTAPGTTITKTLPGQTITNTKTTTITKTLPAKTVTRTVYCKGYRCVTLPPAYYGDSLIQTIIEWFNSLFGF